MNGSKKVVLYIILSAIVVLLFLFCGRTVVADEPIMLNTKSHQVTTPTTIDFSTATVLGLPGVSSVFGRTGDVVAVTGDYNISQITGANATNWDTAYTDRLKWDGGSTGLNAATGRTSLGLVIGTNVQAWDADLDIWAAKTPYAGTLTITSGKILNATNSLTFSGTDGSTLNVGGGGTLGSAAYTASTAYATAAAGMPTGGAPGQVLAKNTATNYDTSWVAAGGTGTVTSVSASNLSPLFTTNVTNSTTTPAIAFTASTAPANSFYGNNTGSTGTAGFVQPNFSNLLGAATTAQAGMPTGGAAGTALIKNSATNYDAAWKSQAKGSVNVTVGTFSTASSTGVHAGAGAAGGQITLNPDGAGKVLIMVSGTAAGGTQASGWQIGLRYGTGTPPAGLAAPTGTAVGTNMQFVVSVANVRLAFSNQVAVTGLTPGQQYWFDYVLLAISSVTITSNQAELTVIEL